MLRTIDTRHQGVQVQLIAAEIEVSPDPFPMVVLRALQTAFRAAPRALPLQANVDALTLEIKLCLRDIPWVFDAQQPSQQLGISHPTPLRRRPDFLLVAHSKSGRPKRLG
jgi:hypothetical protein